MRIYILSLSGAFLLCAAGMGQDGVKIAKPPPAKQREPEPADVFVRVELLRAEVEHIRVYMGMPKNEQSSLSVTGAAPREVFYTALTLFSKADRICFEHTRERAQQPTIPQGEIAPGDVSAMVNAALKCVQRVKVRYGIDKQTAAPERDPEKQPTDVLKAIVQANRQLNLMLERQFAPSDVFQEVTLGVGYTSRLLETFPKAERIPIEPAYEPEKRPVDVYRRLLGCFRRIREIAERSNVRMLDLEVDDAQIDAIVPSDVYDVASLIVAELAYLQSQLPASQPPRNVYFVGRKFPSDVYQRAGMLELQLIELQKQADGKPDWLKHGQTEN